MAPLRTNQSFAELLQSLQNPVLGMLAGALFTALVT
jgi:Na+/phosphate symporter